MLIDNYLNLVPSDNISKPKYMGYLESILTPIIEVGAVVENSGHMFDVDSAAGEQLDILGELVGLSRLLPLTPTVGDRIMDDDEYKMCIKMKIAQNEWDGTNGSAMELYRNAIGDRFSIHFVDNQDMTVDVVVSGTTTAREAEVLFLTESLLVPAGVGTNAIIVDSTVDVGMKIGIGMSGEIIYQSVNMIPNT